MSATARVKVVLEVSVSDSWGEDCKVDQIRRQATESAMRIIGNLQTQLVKIVGTPEVTAVLIPLK